MTFFGYERPDGRVGVRNYVLILPASVCASDTTRIIAQQVNGAVTFNNQQGCSQVESDQQLTMDVMAGYAANPNIYGTVVVSLGCENCQMDLVVKAIQERTNKPLRQVIIQEVGGTLKAVDIAVRYAKEMAAEASLLQKKEFPMSELIIGTSTSLQSGPRLRRSMIGFWRSSAATKRPSVWLARKCGKAIRPPETRPAASPPWRKNPWAVSIRAATVP